jgi:hypothetical protein
MQLSISANASAPMMKNLRGGETFLLQRLERQRGVRGLLAPQLEVETSSSGRLPRAPSSQIDGTPTRGSAGGGAACGRHGNTRAATATARRRSPLRDGRRGSIQMCRRNPDIHVSRPAVPLSDLRRSAWRRSGAQTAS